jgi:hypothetical protein
MSPRRPVHALVVAIAVAACSAAVPSAASACVNAATAKSFQGQAHMIMVLSATGTAPGGGGFETATLDRKALDLHLKLTNKRLGKGGTVFFAGKIAGGAVDVKDMLESSDGTEQQLTFHGGLGALPDFGAAELAFSRSKCKYDLSITYGVNTTLKSEGELETDPEASADMESGPKPLPRSLQLAHSGSIDAYLSCVAGEAPLPQACFSFAGTWTTNFATLALCGSVVAENCKDDSLPVGTASVGWSLKPTLEKKK